MVSRFMSENFLKLNESKCVGVAGNPPVVSCLQPATQMVIPVCAAFLSKKKASAWVPWNSTSESLRNVSRESLFQFGRISVYQSVLSPVSTSTLVKSCCLSGYDVWCWELDTMWNRPSKVEMAKRILKLPKGFSNTASMIALGWPLVHSICTIRKMRHLAC